MICELEINGIYNIENCVFKKSIHLLNTVINAKSNFSDVSFEKNIYIDGPIEINNLLYISKLKYTQRDIKIKEKLKYSLVFSYSELYDQGIEGFPDVYTFGSLAKIYLQNIDFRYLNLDIARIVNFIETLKNNKGQQIINVD